MTNEKQTQCFSTHLTTFAGGFLILPAPINWNYVFANLDFAKNKTIYLTMIIMAVLYIALVIYARRKDRKDIEKVRLSIALFTRLILMFSSASLLCPTIIRWTSISIRSRSSPASVRSRALRRR